MDLRNYLCAWQRTQRYSKLVMSCLFVEAHRAFANLLDSAIFLFLAVLQDRELGISALVRNPVDVVARVTPADALPAHLVEIEDGVLIGITMMSRALRLHNVRAVIVRLVPAPAFQFAFLGVGVVEVRVALRS